MSLELEFLDLPCPVCESLEYEICLQTNLSRNQYHRPEMGSRPLTLASCLSCRSIYSRPVLSPQSLTHIFTPNYEYFNRRETAGLPLFSRINYALLSQLIRKYHPGKAFFWRFLHRVYGASQRVLIPQMSPCNKKVLDVGCGDAFFLRQFAGYTADLYGLDPYYPYENPAPERITLVRRPLEKANFEKDFFDIVFMRGVLEYLRNPREVLQEAFRVLRPGGEMLLFVNNRNSPLYHPKWGLKPYLESSAATCYLLLVDDRAFDHFLRELGFVIATKGYTSNANLYFLPRTSPFKVILESGLDFIMGLTGRSLGNRIIYHLNKP